jgi:hypothetical protein
MMKNNVNIVYNTSSIQNKFNEYLTNKVGKSNTNNIEIVYKTRCESRSRGILYTRKPGYYYVPEFYLSQ